MLMAAAARRWTCVVSLALVLSGCASGSRPSTEASCRPGLVAGGATYREVDDLPSQLSQAEPVADARLSGCSDAGQAAGGGPVDAWRASGLGEEYVVTLTACAQAAGTSAAADCDPNASRYVLWHRESAGPS
jgi:hypothetical protein